MLATSGHHLRTTRPVVLQLLDERNYEGRWRQLSKMVRAAAETCPEQLTAY